MRYAQAHRKTKTITTLKAFDRLNEFFNISVSARCEMESHVAKREGPLTLSEQNDVGSTPDGALEVSGAAKTCST